ncbi:hypothetical protein BSKO_06772 [Bryopsis sp. KO-2023]|nr:hypothetical protein BSKO_06772 [Bryopsis sp. KO-2023]
MKFSTAVCIVFATALVASANAGADSGVLDIGGLRITVESLEQPTCGSGVTPSSAPEPADYSRTFSVANNGGYVIKLTCKYFDPSSSKIVEYRSGGVSLGFTAKYEFPQQALGIECETNIDMVGFPKIFGKHYDSAEAMQKECTGFKVWGTIFDYPWATTC